ncbi:MAG: transglutaminase-like domain-containing protein, partial [Candidatus Syntrophosphaera sp.]
MRTNLVIIVLLSLCAVLTASPRGLTSREIIIEDDLAGVQPQAPLLPLEPAPGESSDPARDTWVPILEQSLDIILPARDQSGLRFSSQEGDAEPFSSLGELLPESVSAVARAPEWIRLELQKTLHQLEPDRQLAFAGLINSASDPYVDEIAFCVATSFPEYLNSSFALPELFLENAEWIYSIADELPYVEVIDTGSAATGGSYHSTTRYWKRDDGGNLVQMDVPRDIYYWYLVHPKITDEIAAYIDPAIIENNSTHSNNIVPPPEGKFWRSYMYGFEEDGYPVLSDTLTQCQTLFNRDGSSGDAARAIIWWINQNMSFTSNAERPHQPVRIFAKRIGRCGEYADLTSAVARTALIPCTNIASISTDHTWNEFWDDGWVSWEPVNGYLNNPLVYENGWGKVFGSVFEERCDGLFTPVTDRYSEGLATINIQVVDENLNPVDAARVVLAIFENSVRFDCEQYTDNQGIATFEVGENRDYRGRTETFFGLYPANPGTYVQLTDNTADGEIYYYQFQIAAPMPLPSIDALSPPNDPEQDHRFCVSFESSGYYVTGRTLYDDIDVLGSPANYY